MRTYKDVNKLPNGPLDPSKKKLYNKMMRKYKKLLKKDVKQAHPYDWEVGLDLFVDFLKWMQSYYELGYNVWAMERKDEDPKLYKDAPTRAETLKMTIYYYDRWQNCCDDYYKIAYSEEELKHYLDLGFHLVSKKDDVIEQSMRKTNSWTLTLYEDKHKNVEECNKAHKDYKKKFFESLEEYLEEWWD